MSIIHSRIMPVFMMGALLIGLPGLVYAESNEGMHQGYRSEHHQGTAGRQHMVSHTFHSLLRHAKDLGLSEQQVEKLKSLMTDYKKARIRDRAEVKLAEVDAQRLVHDQKAEMAAIEAGGSFQIDFTKSSSETTVTRSTQGLLMEGLRLLDEANRDAEVQA